MKLPIPSFGKKEKQKYILALLLRDEKIGALITEEVDGKMKIVGQNEEILTTPLEKLSEEEWLDTLDRAISKAEEPLPPDRETHDTVFGVKESWVDEKKIKKEYLLKLKKLSEALDLKPIGFLVVNEAITHLIQEEEGAPVSAILVDIGNLSISATLVKGGNVLESKTVPRGESLPHSVETAVKHFTSVDVLPSRLMLFSGDAPSGNSEKNDRLAQQFISHHWSKSLPFLHAPQISVLNAGFDSKAVVQGAASQMGFEILNLTLSKTEEIKNYDSEVSDHSKKAKEVEEGDAEEEKTEVAEEETSADAKAMADKKEAEGAENEELPSTKKGKKDEDEKEDNKGSDLPDEDFGFVLNEDVSKNPPESESDSSEKHEDFHHEQEQYHEVSPMHEERLEAEHDEQREERGGNPPSSLLAMLPAISLSGLTSKLPLKNLNLAELSKGSRNKFLLIPVGILVLLVALYFVYTANLKAEVTLYLTPNNVSESTNILFSTDAGNNFSENMISAKTVDADLEGNVSASATGKKELGDKAKGTVTIYNNDSGKKTLSSGTTISTDKGLKFTLDKDVSVGSASGDIFSGTKPGTAQVSVTAAEIGSEYNFPSGTKFNVSGNANIAAKNDSAFSGGTKKAVTVVSKKDQDKLLVELSKSLESKAKEELEKKANGDQKLLPFLTQASVTKKTFDRKVDQEAKTVKLVGTVSYEALVYSEKDIEDFAGVALKKKYSDNLNLSEKGVTVSLKDEKQKDEGEVSATVVIGAGLVPKLDNAALIERIKGKSLSEANDELKRVPQVAKAEIKLSPSLPFIPVSLPKKEDRITMRTALHE